MRQAVARRRRVEAARTGPAAIAALPGYWDNIHREARERMWRTDRLPKAYREIVHEFEYGPVVKLIAMGLTAPQVLEVLTIARTDGHPAAHKRLAQLAKRH